jgi:hypothetical protein
MIRAKYEVLQGTVLALVIMDGVLNFLNNKKPFNVFHVRALYYTKTLNHQHMHKESFIINRNTLLHVSTLLGHLQAELFYRYTKVALYS